MIALMNVTENPKESIKNPDSNGMRAFTPSPIARTKLSSLARNFFWVKRTLSILDAGFPAKGQRSDVNDFLTFGFPRESRTSFEIGTAETNLVIKYQNLATPNNFKATLNGVDVSGSFTPNSGTAEEVTISLNEGRNVLVLKVDGIRTDGRTATDTDRLVFKVG